MTSQRKFKKRAEAQGMTGPELRLLEMQEEILRDMRWMQILAYTNQYLLNEKLEIPPEERDRILEAATRAVDKDLKFHEWNARLGQLKSEMLNIRGKVDSALSDIEAGVPAPPSLDAAGVPSPAEGREPRGEAAAEGSADAG